jgi:signal transduction histidine kinase
MTAVFLSIIIILFVSRRITTPLVELADISRRMTELDFEAKYRPGKKHRHRNEIDVLGNDMNILSQTLEKTISELKSANNQLQIDIEKKEEVDEMRKEFLSNVSHELKTPLALISGYAEGLKECINDDEESRNFYCEVIMDETDKMNRMVKKLLTLNQLEFGNETVAMERFDLTELIRGVVNAQMILMEQSGITLSFDQQEPLYVWADEFKVEEVVTNYLSNAIHHASYEKLISIRYIKKADCVRVCVFNTGDTIPQEDIDNVWIKFYKVDKARTREYGGSGIGLSIVKAIMDSFHRECGVKNCENGVEFWFELDTRSNVE